MLTWQKLGAPEPQALPVGGQVLSVPCLPHYYYCYYYYSYFYQYHFYAKSTLLVYMSCVIP